MRQRLLLIFLIVLAVILCGCAGLSTTPPRQITVEVTLGITKKIDLEKQLGHPATITPWTSGQDVFMYYSYDFYPKDNTSLYLTVKTQTGQSYQKLVGSGSTDARGMFVAVAEFKFKNDELIDVTFGYVPVR